MITDDQSGAIPTPALSGWIIDGRPHLLDSAADQTVSGSMQEKIGRVQAAYRNIDQGDRMVRIQTDDRIGTLLMAGRLHGLEILKHAIKL